MAECTQYLHMNCILYCLQDDKRDVEMRFGFKVFTSGRLSSNRVWQLLKSSSTALLAVLFALTVGTIIFTATLHYPYELLTVHSTVSKDDSVYPVCSWMDRNATLVRYNILKPLNKPNFECIRTRTSPSFTVCLFNIWHDVYISRSLQSARIWEPYLVNEFTEAITRGGLETGVCIFCILVSMSNLQFSNDCKLHGLTKLHYVSEKRVVLNFGNIFVKSQPIFKILPLVQRG